MANFPSNLCRCPFCGGTKLEVWKNTVLCNECGASGPDLGHTDDRPGAIAAWNKRAGETKAPLSDEQLEGVRQRHVLVEQSTDPVKTAGQMAYLSHLDRGDLMQMLERLWAERDELKETLAHLARGSAAETSADRMPVRASSEGEVSAEQHATASGLRAAEVPCSPPLICAHGYAVACPFCPPRLQPETTENPQWTPEQIERAMKQWDGIPLCGECFRPQLYCACAIRSALKASVPPQEGASREAPSKEPL